jgi:hypothetical protein
MHGGSCCLAALKVLEKYCNNVKPLPRKLLFQMYNCVEDRKNYHLNTCILIFPNCKEVFEEVQLGFLVVGHTHEDIDRNFGYPSKN